MAALHDGDNVECRAVQRNRPAPGLRAGLSGDHRGSGDQRDEMRARRMPYEQDAAWIAAPGGSVRLHKGEGMRHVACLPQWIGHGKQPPTHGDEDEALW